MSNVKLIAKNSSILTGGTVITRVLEIVILMMLTRYLSVDGVGIYMAIFAYIGYISIFVDSGLSVIVRRECAADRENFSEYMGNSLSIAVITLLITSTAGYVVLKFSGYPDAVTSVYIFAVPMLITSTRYLSLRKILEVMFIVDFKVHFNVIYVLLDRLLLLACVFWLVRKSHSPLHAIWITVSVEAVSFSLVLITYTKKYGFPKLKIQLKKWKYILSQSLPSLLVSLSHITIFKAGLLMLSALGSAADVAVYGISTRIPLIINFIPIAFLEPITVVLSKKVLINKDAFFDVFSFVSRYLFFMAFPFLLLIFVESDEIISLMFPASYQSAVPIIRILLIAEIFAWSLLVFINGLLAGHQQLTSSKIIGISAIICVVLNLILIPAWGILGAAYSTLIGISCFMVFGIFFKKSRPYTIIMLKSISRPAISAAAMVGILYPLNMNMWASFIAGPVIFFGSLYLIRGFNQRDLGFMLEIFPKSKILNFFKK